MLLSLGIGFLYQAFNPDKKPVRNLTLALLFTSLTFIAIPIAFSFNLKNIYTLLIFMTINGFTQSYTWSTLLVIVNSKWDREKNSTALGFWATNANVGNIVGLLMCEQVHLFNWPWEDEII
jgi:sugar phosphate permease